MDKLLETRPAALAHASQRQHRHPHDSIGGIGPTAARNNRRTFGARPLGRLWRRSGHRRGRNRLVFVDLRLHWLLGRSIILFTGRRAGGNAFAPLANSLSRPPQRIALEFFVFSAAVSFLSW